MKRVLVALSGGVDSSVSAVLLREQGYMVEGAFIKTWSPDWLPCTWREERRDAMRVAAHLGIPFHTVDASDAYKRAVADYMIHEYEQGNTPNPDVMCNKQIKFGVFLSWALEHGFDAIATGHYARNVMRDKQHALLMGADAQKDQSYFLWTLTQTQLSHALFPVGGLQKSDVRTLAQNYQLPTATKKDSQGVCFLGKLNMKEFLSHYITTSPGDVLNTRGECIGTHEGSIFLTLGQRHGFTVTKKGVNDPPLYVVAKDIEHNTVTVAPRGVPPSSKEKNIVLTQTHWIRRTPAHEKEYTARVRYRQALFAVRVVAHEDHTAHVTPLEPQQYVPSGQSLVVYDNEECIGGGIIP